MINITKGKLFELASVGARSNLLSIDSLADKIPNVGTVRASQFDIDSYSYGYINSAHVLNHQLFRHSQVPHVPCDIESGAEYDTGAKKILYRQHLSFWREQSYDASSTGDGVNPDTPYSVPLLAHAMPQMRQQSGWLAKYIHTCTVKTPFIWPQIPSFSNVVAVASNRDRAAVDLNTETESYDGDEIHNHVASDGDIMVFYGKKTPQRGLGTGGYFSRWFVEGISSSIDLAPAGWMYIDCLNDQIIASSRDIHGYGNTSNAGLSSYGYLANQDWSFNTGLASLTASQVPVFQNVSSPTPFMTIPEPNTDPAAVSVDDRTTLPSLTKTTGSIRSNLSWFGERTLWQMRYEDGESTVTYYHRIQQLRCYYTQLYDLQFANPEESIHI